MHTDVCVVSQCIGKALSFNNRGLLLWSGNLYEITSSNEDLLQTACLMSVCVESTVETADCTHKTLLIMQ